MRETSTRSWNSSFANWSPVASLLFFSYSFFFSDIPSSSRSDRRQGRHSINREVCFHLDPDVVERTVAKMA